MWVFGTVWHWASSLCRLLYIFWNVAVVYLLVQQCVLYGFGKELVIRVFDVILKIVIGYWFLFKKNMKLSTCYFVHYIYSASNHYISIFAGSTQNLPWSPMAGHSWGTCCSQACSCCLFFSWFWCWVLSGGFALSILLKYWPPAQYTKDNVLTCY